MPRLPSAAASAAIGAAAALGTYRALSARTDEGWTRTNFRGELVDLHAGPAVAAGAAIAGAMTSGVGVPVAALGAAAVGRYDDVLGQRPEQSADKGLAGHLNALRSGRMSAGVVKVAGLVGVGALAAMLSGRRKQTDIVLDAACIAGSANLINLLDLRPGRALKVSAAAGSVVAPALVGPALALLPLDLRERTMLGDAGANAIGAALGASIVSRRGRLVRLLFLGGVSALTLASERVSFSAFIDANPALRRVDQLGRNRS